jgi:hypothetical protein
MNNPEAEAEDTAGENHKAQRSPVPDAESRQRSRFSREATGLYIARTVSAPGKETAVAAAIAGIAVNR